MDFFTPWTRLMQTHQQTSLETLLEVVQTRQLANRIAASEREQQRQQRPKPQANR